jgi:hypothetical protein
MRPLKTTQEEHVDVRIGVTHTPKEVEVALAEGTSAEDVRQVVDAALNGGETLWLTDRRGRQVCVPTSKLAYVEIGSPDTDRRVGFGG